MNSVELYAVRHTDRAPDVSGVASLASAPARDVADGRHRPALAYPGRHPRLAREIS